jgi:hypothetical protein
MGLFWKKQSKKEYEKLPAQIADNDRILNYHRNSDGILGYLVVDGTAESVVSKEKYKLLMGLSILTWVIGAFVLNQTIFAQFNGSGFLTICFSPLVFLGVHEFLLHLCRDKRICEVWGDRIFIERPEGRKEYALTDVVGVHLGGTDQQRIYEEQRKKRKQKDPEFLEPYSMDVFLETSLGMEDLGSIFGLKDAQDIATSMNTAILYMKGRQGIGEGPVHNPAHQYRNKTAGQIPA